MKINVTYETADIARLIRNDLVRQGLPGDDVQIKFAKNAAQVSIEVSVPSETTVSASPPLPPGPPPAVAPAVATGPAGPTFAVVDGGNAPVDMSDVLGASVNIERNTRPLYPSNHDRQLMEGESYDYPGSPKR